ncbi:MAG: hypothetical protein ACKVW3_04940 [Phycisphaerales bacterium]
MAGKAIHKSAERVDRLMERASHALVATRYFEAERLCVECLRLAHADHDFERMTRVVLPLQEARRQKRQIAVDANRCFLVAAHPPDVIVPGCYLFQPPLIGADARAFREAADGSKVPVLVLTREPLTRDGKWPVVAVGVVSVRNKLNPPWPLERVETSKTKDNVDGVTHGPPPVQWFQSAAEALGDSAIARVNPEDPPAWQVEDLVEYLDAHPDHELLHQRLADTCRLAMTQPVPDRKRRRTHLDHPYSF